ncbi:hypothetical protein PUR49_01130 [Streptomyces sp. BE147]|uniref:hypothetical protein n=1 Tax=Streptomyces sp. BE147 TaxID=3002524 RepID=UPI002E76E3C1|nr:hypothetical protein [Streptomyces sp. BE147]MEE1735154.1 hypothetical protein [Streptomyces sp. BE147]
MKPAPPAVLTNSFYAFYDLHRPAYHAYAAAHLSPEEARIAVSHLFDLIAGNWTSIASERDPSAWAWEQHTRTIARRSGRTPTAAENTSLLYDQLLLSIDQIATVTGTETATVTALLAAANGADRTSMARSGSRTTTARPTAPPEARWRRTLGLRTAAV